MFYLKKAIALGLSIFGISNAKLKTVAGKNNHNYVRIVNYHFSPESQMHQFEKQLQWYLKKFEPCSYQELRMFLNGECVFDQKPGLLLTFDDGYEENYKYAVPLLEKYGFKGCFMVSTGRIGGKQIISSYDIPMDYMSENEIRDLILRGHTIGCHTYTHHRFGAEDTEAVLHHEVEEAKKNLEQIIGQAVDLFTWCGGEEWTYTADAARHIRNAGFHYVMSSLSSPVLPRNNPFFLERTNIEVNWPMYLVKFQVSGFIDKRFEKKRARVHKLISSNKELS